MCTAAPTRLRVPESDSWTWLEGARRMTETPELLGPRAIRWIYERGGFFERDPRHEPSHP